MIVMMAAEIRYLPWPAVHLEIGWRRADDHALARDAARDHPGLVLQIAGADGKIVAILCKIGDADR